jgi:hypothetical protein
MIPSCDKLLLFRGFNYVSPTRSHWAVAVGFHSLKGCYSKGMTFFNKPQHTVHIFKLGLCQSTVLGLRVYHVLHSITVVQVLTLLDVSLSANNSVYHPMCITDRASTSF